jgi:hypothetical protein
VYDLLYKLTYLFRNFPTGVTGDPGLFSLVGDVRLENNFLFAYVGAPLKRTS